MQLVACNMQLATKPITSATRKLCYSKDDRAMRAS